MTDTFEVELTAMAHGGSALGRYDKRTVFIPYTLPGERVLAQIKQDKGRILFAEGVKLLEASTDRVYPRCPHFGPGRCGRCQWQHIDYDAQLLLKQDVLNDQLARIGGFDDETIEAVVQPVIPSPQQWDYNYQMTFYVTENGALGLPAADGDAPFLIEECHILHPDLLALFQQLDLDVSGLSKLRLQMGSDGEQMVVISIDDEANAPELQIDLPISVNLLLPDNEPINLIGDLNLRYEIGGRTFRVSAGSYFRENLSQLSALTEIVLRALNLTGNEAVLDLYSGVGFFSAFIAPYASLVTLVESYPPAAADADYNLSDFEHVDVIEGTVEDVLPELETQYQAVIVDPSHEGLSIEVMDRLAELKIPKLVYVSSDPAIFARDAKRLSSHGYQLAEIQPIDLAPQTFYIQSISTFICKV